MPVKPSNPHKKPPAKLTHKRSASSKAYLERQAADPFVHASRAKGYRSRAAFKLLDIAEKHHIFKGGQVVIDLGCAPGSWSQVVTLMHPSSIIVGLDVLPTDPLAGCTFLELDINADDAEQQLLSYTKGRPINVVMSDMAANTVGHRATDGLRTQLLVELAIHFALQHLTIGGHFISKVFQNGAEPELRKTLQPHFEKVVFHKPPASRADSREVFLVALNRLTI